MNFGDLPPYLTMKEDSRLLPNGHSCFKEMGSPTLYRIDDAGKFSKRNCYTIL
jgi:hypothetical protein